jgi:SAM-dependent methyltransferase
VLLAGVALLSIVAGLHLDSTAPCAAPPTPQRRGIVQPKESIPGPNAKPDCVFSPSPAKVVDAVLKLAAVQPGEILFDLGCGDGRICIAAAQQYRARAYGYEIQPDLVKEARANVKKNKVAHLVTIERRDIFKLDLSGADVVTLWLLPALNVMLIPQLEKMKPGSRIVSVDFDMLGVVKPDKVIEVNVKPARWFDSVERQLFLWKTPLKKNEKLFWKLSKELERVKKSRK